MVRLRCGCMWDCAHEWCGCAVHTSDLPFPCCTHCTHSSSPQGHAVPCIPCGQGQPNGDDQ